MGQMDMATVYFMCEYSQMVVVSNNEGLAAWLWHHRTPSGLIQTL